MPEKFWLIEYHKLVWDRSLLAFVPRARLLKVVEKEFMERAWFLTLDDAESQAEELRALNVVVRIYPYTLSET